MLNLSKKYDHAVQDPAKPEDPNEYLWRGKDVVLDLTNYRINDVSRPDKDVKAYGNYIEGFRIVGGKKESKPALKIFITPEHAAVVVLDADKEGTDGFGLPDYVEKVGDLLSVDVVGAEVLGNDTLLANLFKETEQEKRIPPKLKAIFVEIAPIGSPIVEWELCAADKSCDPNVGWRVPFEYGARPRKDNYVVRIHFKKAGHVHNPDQPVISEYLEIDWIAKQWTGTESYEPSIGKVWEYFRPKGKFAFKVQAKVLWAENPKKIHFEFEDGETQDIVVNQASLAIEDQPFAISFNEGEKTRWWIEKSKGSQTFDKRKRVGPPSEKPDTHNDENPNGGMMGMPIPAKPMPTK